MIGKVSIKDKLKQRRFHLAKVTADEKCERGHNK